MGKRSSSRYWPLGYTARVMVEVLVTTLERMNTQVSQKQWARGLSEERKAVGYILTQVPALLRDQVQQSQ